MKLQRSRSSAPRLTALAAGALLALSGCGGDEDQAPTTTATDAAPEPAPKKQTKPQKVESAGSDSKEAQTTLATGLEIPWGIAFLPNGDALVSERATGRILRLDSESELSEEMTVPDVNAEAGEGGLLGLAVSPTYEKDGLVYAYLTSDSEDDNRIVRFELGGEPEVIFDGIGASSIHNGGRIAFGPDGKLYAGVGDAGVPEQAQDPDLPNGKILRLDPDGSVPEDNPVEGSPVYSLGHRNVQGLAWDSSGRLWATEFGQDTFDEVNLIKPGENYGWPEVEGVGEDGDYVNPQVTWATSESSPSGAAIVDGDLYVAALAGQRLWRVPLDQDQAGDPEALLTGEFGRIRTAAEAPDGSLWIATSNTDGRGSPAADDDRIVRLLP